MDLLRWYATDGTRLLRQRVRGSRLWVKCDCSGRRKKKFAGFDCHFEIVLCCVCYGVTIVKDMKAKLVSIDYCIVSIEHLIKNEFRKL